MRIKLQGPKNVINTCNDVFLNRKSYVYGYKLKLNSEIIESGSRGYLPLLVVHVLLPNNQL